MKIWIGIAVLAGLGYLYMQGGTLTANSPVGAKTGDTVGPIDRIKLGWCNTFGGCS